MQSAPLPFLPPLEPDETEECNRFVALKLVKLGNLAWDTMYRMVSGFREQPSDARLAFYLSHEPFVEYLQTPNQIPTAEVDPMGMPVMMPAPSLMEINSAECAWMMADYAKLLKQKAAKVDESTTFASASADVPTSASGFPSL
jgi:hypothetical protein